MSLCFGKQTNGGRTEHRTNTELHKFDYIYLAERKEEEGKKQQWDRVEEEK